MITINDLNPRRLVESLASTTCPACGQLKQRRNTLCRGDYFRLPGRMRAATYNHLGEGYAEAVLDALIYLNAQAFIDPVGGSSLRSPRIHSPKGASHVHDPHLWAQAPIQEADPAGGMRPVDG